MGLLEAEGEGRAKGGGGVEVGGVKTDGADKQATGQQQMTMPKLTTMVAE